jgi:hypothetical protein
MNKFIKQIMLLLGCLISFWAGAQNLITPINIALPTNPPANTADWATALPPVMILAQTKLVNGQVNGMVQESRILVTIKSGGSKVCGTYTPQNAPTSNFNSASKNWSGANVLSLLGQECTLNPGSYELCVQFYSMPGAVESRILGESCKPFTIADKKKEAESYSPPQNVFPNNNKIFTEKETKAPIVFRWTPVVPKPKAQVTYKLKVWEVEEGQNATQARKMNAPLLEKDVKEITQSVEKITFPPRSRQANYTWNVEASKQNQMGELEMLGASEPTSFSVSSVYIIKLDSIRVVCTPTEGIYGFSYTITNPNPGAATLNSFALTSSVPSSAALTSFYPSIGTVINPGAQLTISGFVSGSPALTNVCLGAEIKDVSNSFWKASKDTCAIVPQCRCNLCDTNIVKWTLPTQISYSANQTNNIAALSGPISFGPYPIVKLSTEIVDFYWYTEGDCKKCNTNDYYFGNLTGGSLTGMVGGTSVAGPLGTPIPSSHQLDFISPTLSGVTISNNINLNISLPPQTQLSCCTDCFRFCIRYTATFMQNGVCKTCSIVKCYETKRVHKKVGLQMYPPLNDCGERGQIIIKDKTGMKEN